MRILKWFTYAVLLILMPGCGAPATNPTPMNDVDELTYLLTKICIPTIADGVPFSKIVKTERLQKHTSCSIQDCTTLYCTSNLKRACIAPVMGPCDIEILRNNDFSLLNNVISGILNKDSRKWHAVRTNPIFTGYKTAYCDTDESIKVSATGFSPDQVLGVIHGPGTDIPIKSKSTEFDITVSIAEPASCILP